MRLALALFLTLVSVELGIGYLFRGCAGKRYGLVLENFASLGASLHAMPYGRG